MRCGRFVPLRMLVPSRRLAGIEALVCAIVHYPLSIVHWIGAVDLAPRRGDAGSEEVHGLCRREQALLIVIKGGAQRPLTHTVTQCAGTGRAGTTGMRSRNQTSAAPCGTIQNWTAPSVPMRGGAALSGMVVPGRSAFWLREKEGDHHPARNQGSDALHPHIPTRLHGTIRARTCSPPEQHADEREDTGEYTEGCGGLQGGVVQPARARVEPDRPQIHGEHAEEQCMGSRAARHTAPRVGRIRKSMPMIYHAGILTGAAMAALHPPKTTMMASQSMIRIGA